MFKKESCDLCAECFVRCPEMRLDPIEAKAEIQNLMDGSLGRHALSSCSSCFSCNAYCPQDANPYHLVLQRWNDRYRTRGAPPLYRMVCPNQEPNLWSSFYAIAPLSARASLDEWMTVRPAEEVILIGSYNYLIPEVFAGSSLIEGAVPLALPQHWECGAYLNQGGYLDVVKRIGEMVREDLDSLGVKRVICTMDAVYHMFTRIQPEEMGTTYEQEFVDFYEWVLGRFDSGELKVDRPLGLTVTVHDNCYAKAEGDRYFDQARKLLEVTGCEVREMDRIRENALCCGFGLGASWEKNYRMPFEILRGSMRKIREAERTGAPVLVTYCGGCMWLLLVARELMGSDIKVMHVLELLREAMGEPVNLPREERAWDIVSMITYQIIREMVRGPFFIDQVRAECGGEAWERYPKGTLRAIRSALSGGVGREVYRVGFKAMDSLVGGRRLLP